MDNQTVQNGGVRDTGNQTTPAIVIDGQKPAVSQSIPTPAPRRRTKFIPRALIIFFVVALLAIGGAVWFLWQQGQQSNNAVVEPAKQFDVMQLPLSDLGSLTIEGARSLSINGQLRVNNSLVITPTAEPENAVAGQLYYNKDADVLSYYNGSEFVDLQANEDEASVESLGGINGSVALGGGLAVSDATLVNTGALSVQGQTGDITLSGGPGIVVDGTTISNTGLLSLGGQTGNINIGSGLSVNNGTVQNTGVLEVTAGSNISIIDTGSGSFTISSTAAGGNVSTLGGTVGRLAKFTGVNELGDSLLSESGSTITVHGNLSVTGTTTLDTPLAVTSGGIGVGSLAVNGVVIGQGTGALNTVTAGGVGQCLVSTAGAPVFQACPGSSGVSSLNGLSGILTIANASAVGSTITINDASTTGKGIAQFDGTNFTVSNGVVDTIQDISVTASPTFGQLTLTGDLAVNGGDITSSGAMNITPGGTLTLGATNQQTILQGNANTQITATGGGFTTTVGFSGIASGNVVYNFDRSVTAGTYTICSTAGNCAGTGGGVTTPGGTTNRLAKFTAGQVVGDSTITDDGTNVTTSVDLIVQGGDVTLGVANSQTGSLNFAHSGSAFTGTITQGALTADRTYVLPDASGTFCLTSGNCSGAGSANTLQAAYDAGNTITTTVGRDIVFTLSDLATDPNFLVNLECDTSCGSNGRFAVQNDGADVFTVNPTGATTVSITGNTQVSGDFNVTGNTTIGDAATDQLTINSTISGGTPLVFEGATVDANELSINIGTLTADRNVTFGDESGTVCLQGSGNCGFAPSSGSGNYINNTSTLQTNANIAIQSASDSATTLFAQSRATQTANLFELRDSSSNLLAGFGPTGNIAFQNSTNSADAFRVNNAAGNSLLAVNTASSAITIGQTGATTTVVGNLAQNSGTVNLTANGASSISTTSGTLTLQSTNSSNNIVINGGSNTMALSTGASGTITVGSAGTSTVNIGALTDDARTVNVGVGTGGSQTQTVNVGSTGGDSATVIQGGTGDITLATSSGNTVQVGSSTADADSTLLVVDSYNSTDPTGVNGGIYYNTADAKLRCYEGGQWKDCVTETAPSEPPEHLTGTGNVTTTSSTSAGSTSVVCDKPANLANGQLLIAYVFHRGPGTLTPPAGWTAFTPEVTNPYNLSIYYQPIYNASSEPSTYTFTSSIGGRWICNMGIITGADLSNPLDSSGSTVSGGTTSLVLPEVTTQTTNTLMLGFGAAGRGDDIPPTLSTPTGMTQIASTTVVAASGTASSGTAVWAQAIPAIGATGTRTSAISPTASDSTGFMIAIKAAAPGANPATLQSAYNASTGGEPEIKINSGQGGVDIQDADSSLGINLLNVRASNAAGLGDIMFGISSTGAATFQNDVDSTAALQVLNAAGASVLNVNTTTNSVTASGDVLFSGLGTVSGTGYSVLCINDTTGELERAASTTNCNPSSNRYKENVATLPDSMGLDIINALRPVGYNYKGGDGANQIGLIAEEVAQVLPEVVAYDDQGLPASINYELIVANLVKAVQQQQVQLSQMEANVLSGALVEISGHIRVSKDTSGTVTIPAGETSATVTFSQPYEFTPKITTSVSEFVQTIVTDKSKNGFTVQIAEPKEGEVKIDWTALEVEEP